MDGSDGGKLQRCLLRRVQALLLNTTNGVLERDQIAYERVTPQFDRQVVRPQHFQLAAMLPDLHSRSDDQTSVQRFYARTGAGSIVHGRP